MTEWSRALDRFEWLALVNSRALGSNFAQVSASDCPTILSGLYKREGLFLIEKSHNSHETLMFIADLNMT